jgi:hypothetical protein
METKGLKKGRLKVKEREYIIRACISDGKPPETIAKEINKSTEAVVTYLNKEVPDWWDHLFGDDEPVVIHENNKAFHKQVLELAEGSGTTYADAKKLVRKEDSLPIKTIENLDHLLDSLYCQRDYLTRLTEQVANSAGYWKKAAAEWAAAELTSQRRDLEIQKIKLYGELTKKHNMLEPPAPTMTAEEHIKSKKKYITGIYFAWEDGHVVYVGASNEIHRRIAQHVSKSSVNKGLGKIRPDMLVSWLEVPKHKLYTTECFYIWCLQPKLNGEIIKDSHYIKDGHSDFAKSIEQAMTDGDKGDD